MAGLGILAVAGAMLVLRRPEAFMAAEFTWEEGSAFYAPLFFNAPGALIFEPWGGYLQVLPRLGYELLRVVPVAWAPLAENVLAALAIVGLAAYVASSRMARIVPSPILRLALAVLLLVLPAQGDVMGSWVNVQWYGALWLGLLAMSDPPRNAVVRWGERSLAALASLSGPFSTLLAPVYWWRFARQRTSTDAWLAAIITAGGTIQLALALASGRGDVVDARPLPMSIAIFGLHVGIVPVLGERLSNAVGDAGLPAALTFLGGIVLIGLIVAVALRSLTFRVVPFVYAASIIGLTGIAVHGGANVWPPGENERYFLLGAALVVATIAVATAQRRLLFVPLSLLLLTGIAVDFRLDAHPQQGWEQTHTCIGSPTPCVIPIWPPEYDIRWPGHDGTYQMPDHIDP